MLAIERFDTLRDGVQQSLITLLRGKRLTRALAGATVAVVEAGGGYGKTTLALELADELGIARVLTDLTAGDADARALLARLRTALRRASLSDLAAVLADPTADPDELVDDLLRGLVAEVEPVLVIVDDAHYLRDPDAGRALGRLADAVRDPHRLVVLTRQVRGPMEDVARRATEPDPSDRFATVAELTGAWRAAASIAD